MVGARYPYFWRVLHALIALLVVIMIPVGFWMADRGAAGLWDGLTGSLYASHKAIGFLVLWLMVLRLVIRLSKPTPPYVKPLPPVIRLLAHATHHAMYVLLFAVPLLGWAGVTAFPALVTLGGYDLPAMPGIAQDQVLAKQLFAWHGWLATALAALIVLHIAGALKHGLIDRDHVIERMSLRKDS
jgi:cytochrome b561